MQPAYTDEIRLLQMWETQHLFRSLAKQRARTPFPESFCARPNPSLLMPCGPRIRMCKSNPSSHRTRHRPDLPDRRREMHCRTRQWQADNVSALHALSGSVGRISQGCDCRKDHRHNRGKGREEPESPCLCILQDWRGFSETNKYTKCQCSSCFDESCSITVHDHESPRPT